MTKLRLAAAGAVAVTICTLGVARADELQFGEKATINGPAGYVSIGALALRRSDPGGNTIVTSNPGGVPYLKGRDFDLGWSPGIDAAAGIKIFDNSVIEGRVMYSDMDADYDFTAPGNFIGVGFTGPGGTRFNSEYQTKLTSWEINYRYYFNDRLSILGGFRSLDVKDSMKTVLNANVATGRYDADNEMLGGQIGAQYAFLNPSNPFQLDVSGKIGAFSNQSGNGIFEYQGDNFIGSFKSGSVHETNFAGELGISAGYRIFDNVRLTAGYQLLWIKNLAQASNAASSSVLNPSLLRDNVYRDDVLFHGFNVALSVNW